jgi:hypothetical protein
MREKHVGNTAWLRTLPVQARPYRSSQMKFLGFTLDRLDIVGMYCRNGYDRAFFDRVEVQELLL